MTRSELLDHLWKHVLDDKTDMLEGAPDSVWTPELLTRYLTHAERLYCRQAWALADDTTAAVCQVPLVLDTAKYTLHSSIVRVLSVTPNDSQVDLSNASYDNIRPRASPVSNEPWGVSTVYNEASGRPRQWSTDRPVGTLRIRPAPSAAEVAAIVRLNLRVIRLPLTTLDPSEAESDPSPEIPEQYHLDLVDYAAGRALTQSNVDRKAHADGKDFLKTFYANVRLAKQETDAAARAPAVFQFGGWGRGGD